VKWPVFDKLGRKILMLQSFFHRTDWFFYTSLREVNAMKVLSLLITVALLGGFIWAAAKTELEQPKVIAWMRAVNTREAEFNMANHRFANADELRAFVSSTKKASTGAFIPKDIAPYLLQVTTSGDGSHYLATIKSPSDMNDKSTWCQTAAFSDETGIIYVGQSIGCSGADKLGVSSQPSN